MKRIYLIALAISLALCLSAQTLNNPESIVKDNFYPYYCYVSNAGTGQILRTQNLIQFTEYASGLGSVRGLIIHNRTLYAASAMGLAVFDLVANQHLSTISIPGSMFLNDVVADSSGNIYISDTQAHKIFMYRSQSGTVSAFITTGIQNPNGMTYDYIHNRILLVSFRANSPIQSISLPDGQISTYCDTNLGNLDGIGIDSNGAIYFSSWETNCIYILMHPTSKPIPVFRGLNGPADFSFYYHNNGGYWGWVDFTNKIYIPNMNSNTIIERDLPNYPIYFEAILTASGESGGPSDNCCSWMMKREVRIQGYNLYYTTGWNSTFSDATLINPTMIPAQNAVNAYYGYPIYNLWYDNLIWLEVIDINGNSNVFGPVYVMVVQNEDETASPTVSQMQVYPNPVKDNAFLSFELGKTEVVSVYLYDVKGRQICARNLGAMSIGKQTLELSQLGLDIASVKSGMYLCRLQAGERSLSRKLTIIK